LIYDYDNNDNFTGKELSIIKRMYYVMIMIMIRRITLLLRRRRMTMSCPSSRGCRR